MTGPPQLPSPASSPTSVTLWLGRLREGDPEALERVLPMVYDELRVLARAQLRGERPDHTLSPTALVHEAYMRLAGREELSPTNRHHFFAVAAQAMRRVLIDYARTRNRKKRGAGESPVTVELALLAGETEAEDLLALDDAIERLAQANERAARVVEQRFFAGLTLEEVAEVLGVSLKTVQRDWTVARAWLRKEIGAQL